MPPTAGAGLEPPDPRRETDLDTLLHATWARAQVTPGPAVEPGTWLRRVTLLVAGRLPTPREIRALEADDDAAHRRRIVSRLLAEPGFAQTWGRIYASWFIRPKFARRPAFRRVARRYYEDATGRSYAEVVRELLTARGAVHEVPAATFLASQRPGRMPEELAAITLDLFLDKPAYYCAQCHDHPEDPRVRQEDLWHVAAYFARTRTPRRRIPGEPNVLEVREGRAGELRRPEVPADRRRVIEPRFLDGRSWLSSDGDATRREALAEAIVAHPDFASAFVRRIWAEIFGAPPDPRLSPAVGELARIARNSHYDLRAVVGAIAESAAMTRAPGAGPSTDARNLLAWFPVRPMPADLRLDAVLQVTSATASIPHFLPIAERAMRIEGARRRYRHVFDEAGQGTGVAGTLTVRLAELHDPVVLRATRFRPGSRLDVLSRAHPDPRERLAALYLWVFGRRPTAGERDHLLGIVASSPDPGSAWEDIFHAALLSAEFGTIH